MALTVNPDTKVWAVLQADLTFISGALYDLDTNELKLNMMDVLSSEDYIWMDDSFIHNTQVTVAGTTFARTIEIINGHSITLEDTSLAYSVRMINSNNNMFDVENGILNPTGLVTVISTNSGGLIVEPTSTPPTPVEIADAVWDEPMAAHTTADTFGVQVKNNLLTFVKWIGLK
jgi:hypothetical protein